jgi:hypothetical protein
MLLGEIRFQPAESADGRIGVDRGTTGGKVCGLIFVGEKDRVHGEDAQGANGPGLDGVAA